MIELACIFTAGGVILFYEIIAQGQISLEIVNKLILINFVNQKNDQICQIDQHNLVWIKDNNKNIFFLVAYPAMYEIEKIDLLLKQIQEKFMSMIYPQIQMEKGLYNLVPSFKEEFKRVVDQWMLIQQQIQNQQKKPKDFYLTKKGSDILRTTRSNDQKAQLQAQKNRFLAKQQSQGKKGGEFQKSNQNPDNNSSDDDQQKEEIAQASSNEDEIKIIQQNREKLKKAYLDQSVKPQKIQEEYVKSSPKKTMAESSKTIVNSQSIKQLDKSDQSKQTSQQLSQDNIEQTKQQYLGGDSKISGFYSSDEQTDSDEEEKSQSKGGFFSSLKNKFKQVTGNKVLEKADLEPVMVEMMDILTKKNVAQEVAQKICESITKSMLNTKTEAFTSVTKAVKKYLEQALTQILLPKRQIDLIQEVKKSKEKGKPYTVTFIGVNGVGKSTNLAKVAYLLKNQGFSIMLAACDNFRSGAVEQIKTHARCLDIPIFEKGYREESADIAYQAIKEASLRKIDVVLIDTAGRMQDNEPLMKQLSRLIIMNNIDLIVFIGEALVGNDAIDQLTKFNKAIIDLSPKDKVREIDAILLSKFDTVDDKVGASISMVYSTGKPILYVGVGQKYIHLKKLNVKTIVHHLMD